MGFVHGQNVGSSEIASSAQRIVETGQLMLHKASTTMAPLANGHFENWGESAMADNSQQTDTSTDVDTDDKHQVFVCFSSSFLLFV